MGESKRARCPELSSTANGSSVPTADTDEWESEESLGLVSRLLGHGQANGSSQAAAWRLLRRFRTPDSFVRASREEIRRATNISQRQAETLAAAVKLGRLLCATPLRPGQRFVSSRDLFCRYRARFYAAKKEYFISLQLDSKNQLIREVLISIGSLSVSIVHPREVYAPAIRDSSASLILFHNHPSGDPMPSVEDRECTRRLWHAGRILGIRILDHIVLGHDDYFSFADQGLLSPGS